MFQKSFEGVSRKIKGFFNGVLSGFQECLKEVEWMFEGYFQGVSRMYQGSFKED